MLTATITQEGKTWKENLFVIDSHSHLGQDEDGAAMMNPLAPNGTFDFWGNVQGKIKADWEKKGEQSFNTIINGKNTTISWEFTPYPFTDSLYVALEKIGQRHSDLKEKARFYSMIDQGVCFPFQDVFRAKQPEALYHASNLNVSRFTTRFPFSLKLIGYARCDPMEGQKAVDEVKFAREALGLRGLKLHPRSEGWIDNINSEKAINVLVEAAKYSLPIIFDTRGKGSIMAISELISSARNVIKTKHPDLLQHFKVIIAHFAQGNIGDHDVYNAIVQPNTYGDLSMLHGEGAGNFFEDFRKWFKASNKITVDGRDWSEYLLFASDYPYFGDVHAEKLMIYIINKRFFDSGGTIKDTRNILGLNQIKLLPEYNLPQINRSAKLMPTMMASSSVEGDSAYQTSIKGLAHLIANNQVDIKKFCLQFQGGWQEFNDDVYLTAVKPSDKTELNLWISNLVKDNSITLLAPFQSEMEWQKFGYKYFDPKTRAFFAKFFKTCYLANDENKAKEVLTQIIT